MTKQELRVGISQILVKWSMPTRQVAITEIMQLFDKFENGEEIKEVKKPKK